MVSFCSSFGKVILLQFLASLAVIGVAVNAVRIRGTFQCTGRDTQVACDRNDLPEVLDGSFDCPRSTDLFIGDACNLTCFYRFHPTSANQTVCEPGVAGNRIGKWSKGNIACQDCSDLFDGRIYRFVLNKMSVSNATENCNRLNSSLVFIESQEEDQFVHQLVLKCAPDRGPWKGWTWIRNKASDNVYCHGTILSVKTHNNSCCGVKYQYQPGFGYVNWDFNEPNAGRNARFCAKEDCVGMKYDSGRWHDQCCNRPFYSICEQN